MIYASFVAFPPEVIATVDPDKSAERQKSFDLYDVMDQ